DGFTRATQLKPDEGTPDLPGGRVRVRLETDGTLHDVMEYEVEKCNVSESDLCEDLSDLQSVNECGVLHTLISRAKANIPLTTAGPNLVSLWPPLQTHSKTPKSRRGESVWDAPPALAALVKRVYLSMVGTRRDHSVCAVGRSGTGKTTACQAFTQALLKQAGTTGQSIMERVQAMFTILRSFGCVSSQHSDASSRFAMVFSLDFNHAGQAAAGHLQTMMLDKWKVCQKTAGESNFLVFSQMLAGLSVEMRTELQLHQLPESNSFGIVQPTKVEEKQRASVAFTKLLTAMKTLGFSAGEQKAIWHVLAGIYHLGAAGACKVGRRQFVNFDSAQVASSVLGCEGEELHTAVFKHHLQQLLQRATGGKRERNEAEEGPRLTAAQCVNGMAAGLYEEVFSAVVSLINRALSSEQLVLASMMVVDTPGLRSPRHSGEERGANWSELCHNYLQERLLEHYHSHTFTHSLERYGQVPQSLQPPSPSEVVCAIDQPPPQVRAADGDPRGLLWVLDEEMVTPASSENGTVERVCQYYSNTGKSKTVRQCEQPLQCEVNHLMGYDPIRYDLSGWFSLIQNNPSVVNATSLGPSLISLTPLCRGLGGLEGSCQHALLRNSTIRKTFSGGMATIRRHSQCIAVKLQADALVNLIRRVRPVFLQCVCARTTESGSFDIPALRAQLHSTQILSALQLFRTGYPEHMALSDFRCHFQALSPPIMKRYASMFVSHNERQAVEELLVELDVNKKSIVVGSSRVFMKRGVLHYLEQQRDQQVTSWLVHLQAAGMGHLARQKYRRLKVQQMAVKCLQRNLRVLRVVATWSWWKLFCKVRPLLDVNMDNERLRAKEDEISALRRRLEKSEKERNELRQTADSLETKVTAVTSELSDERFRGDAVGQALDVERAERLRLSRENKDLQVGPLTNSSFLPVIAQALNLNNFQYFHIPLCVFVCMQESQAEVSRLQKQKEELCAQIRDLSLPVDLALDSVPDLKKQLRLLESQAGERDEEITKLSAKIQQQQQVLTAHTDVQMRFEMEMERMKQIHQKELEDKEEELEDVHKSSQRRLRQLEMQLEQEYEEKQMVIHEKHDLEGLVATLCDQVGHRDFDVEKKLRRDLKRTHALLADAQLLLATIDSSGQSLPDGSKDQIEHLHCQLEESESKLAEAVNMQKTLSQELDNTQVELENICRQKSLVDEQLALLQHEKVDLLKRLEEDQEDLNELMKKHKALIAQSSSDISQIRDLQAELEEVKKQRQSLQEELQQCVSRLQFLESSTVGRSIVSKQEARVCDLENKLEFQKGQVKRFEVLVLRLRDSVVRLGEELEQSAQAEARERENARYYQQRLQEMRVEMEELSQREQESSRRQMELEMQVEELTAVRQTLQADLETSIRRIVDLQAALEEVESSDESDSESSLSLLLIYSSCVDLDDEGSEAKGVGARRVGQAPSSSALSELLDGLRKRRAGGDAGERAGSAVSLPIYQTTGASALRRRASTSLPSLPHLSSLSSPVTARHPPPSLSIPEEDLDEPLRSVTTPIQHSPQTQRRCTLGNLTAANGSEGLLVSEPLVFQNRCLAGDRSDAASDILPAIRRAQSTSSLAGSVRGGRRALSVHFGELPPSIRSRKASETDSSSSGGSGGSSQGSGPKCRFQRPQGERLEAEGSEGGDVALVMKKYLRKETD
uniref:Myosin XVIIIB n=1 Tax=Kryptolebias marmoratus TaxID=37003 RepID=A0A3Q3GHY2_KRYMA